MFAYATYSMAGHFAETIHTPIGMYAASKYALNALSMEIRHELIEAKLSIKVTVRFHFLKQFVTSKIRYLEIFICQYDKIVQYVQQSQNLSLCFDRTSVQEQY